MTRFLLAIDQGTTGSTALVLSERAEVLGRATQEFPATLPPTGLGRARDRRDLDERAGCGGRRVARRFGQGGGLCRHRHHESARDHGGVGARDRRARPPRDRVAGPAHRAALRATQGRRARAAVSRAHRPRARPVLQRDQARVAARQRRRRARARRRAASLRSARSTAGSAQAQRRRAARDRRVERIAHAALSTSVAAQWDDELLAHLRVPRAMLPEVRGIVRGVRSTRAACRCCRTGSRSPGMAGDQQAALFGQACFTSATRSAPTARARSCC